MGSKAPLASHVVLRSMNARFFHWTMTRGLAEGNTQMTCKHHWLNKLERTLSDYGRQYLEAEVGMLYLHILHRSGQTLK